MSRVLRGLGVSALAALVVSTVASPAHATDFVGIGMRITVYYSSSTVQVCATAVKTGAGAAVTTDVVLDVAGSAASTAGLVTPLVSNTQNIAVGNVASTCSHVFDVSGSATSYVLHVGAVAATTTGLTSFAGECEAGIARAAGVTAAPVILNGCP
jgi:hypothetical protein